MKRRMTALSLDLVIEYPEHMDISDPTTKEVQDFLKQEFAEFLQSAEHIDIYFDIDEEEEE